MLKRIVAIAKTQVTRWQQAAQLRASWRLNEEIMRRSYAAFSGLNLVGRSPPAPTKP